MIHGFVDFLVDRGYVTPEQAERIEAWSSRQHDPIGIIAVEHGLIIGRQIDEVLEAQVQEGGLFGIHAVDLGHLNRGTLDALLEVQRVRHWSRVAEAVVLAGILPAPEIFRAFGQFIFETFQGGHAAARVAA